MSNLWISKKMLQRVPICEEAWSIVRPEILESDRLVRIEWTVDSVLELSRKDAEGPNVGVIGWYEHIMGARHALKHADLKGKDLSGLNLRAVDMSYADLSDADMVKTNLKSADLSHATLAGADMSKALVHKARLPEGWKDMVYRQPGEW